MPAGKSTDAAAQKPGEKALPDRTKDGSASGGKAGDDRPKVEEIGGPKGPEPTRYGDWEKGGRCSDF